MSNVKVTNLLHGSSASNNITLASDGTTTIPTVKATTQVLVGGVSSTANGGTLQISNGITFPATQSACSDVNTLDDYEEGTFTPSLKFGGNSTGMTYASGRQFGRYTKIGRMVYFYIFIQLANKGSSTGSATITNLPFTSANLDAYIPMSYWIGSMASITALMPRVSNASTELILWQLTGSSYADTTEANYTNSTSLQLSGQYEV